MRLRGTFFLFLVAAALFGYIWIFERHAVPVAAPGDSQRVVLPGLDPARVSVLTITQSNGVLRVERVGGRWHLVDPAYPAQGLLVDNWLESVAALRLSTHLDATDLLNYPGGLAALGLDPPRATITMEQGSNRYQFRLGQRTPLGEKLYLQMLGSDGVEITGSQPLDRLPPRAAAWRDPQFLALAGQHIDRLQMRSGAREYEVQRDLGGLKWRLSLPRPARADYGRVEQLLQQLQNLQITGFVSEITPPDLEPYGLQSPQATLHLSQGSNVITSVEFGSSPTNAPELILARRSNLPGIVLVPRQTFELVAVPYAELLDYRLLDIPFESVHRIEVSAGESTVLERRAGGGWNMTEPAGVPADPALTATFLESLRGLRVLDVAKEVVTELDLPTYGLAPPERSLTLYWTNGANANGGLSSNVSLRVDFGSGRSELQFARRSDETPVYQVATQAVAVLPWAPFQLRERRLWDFTTNQVTSVTLSHQGETRKFLRSTSGQWVVAPGSQGMVTSFALEEAMYRFGTLRAGYWVARGAGVLERYGIPQLDHRLTIEIQRDGRPETLQLRFGATSLSGGPYTAIELEGQPTVFECPADVFYPYDEVVRSMDPRRSRETPK